MQRTSIRPGTVLFCGLALFSMFFGAGNLIVPPFLGAQAGVHTWPAMAGFALSAVGLPILGVVAVAKSGGLDALAGRVGRRFAFVFTLLVYLSIGPGLAIPRTASTSFEMAVTPFFPSAPGWVLPVYALAFFAAAMALALRPDKLTDRLGKITGPCLLALILCIVVGCFVYPPGGYGPALGAYQSGAAARGFVDGYQTMDTIAALNFGIVIALNLKARGVPEGRPVVRCTVRAGYLAGGVLLLVYALLAHVGAVSGGAFPGAENGAEVLSRAVSFLYGPVGSVLLGLIFVIACLNTCIGLFSSCSQYFATVFPRLSYRAWVLVFGVVSYVVSIFGLNAILAVSVPVLNALYPVAIVLIVLGLCHRVCGKAPLCYPMAVAFCGVVSVLYALESAGLALPLLTDFLHILPLYQSSLCWVLPAALGGALGAALSLMRRKRA